MRVLCCWTNCLQLAACQNYTVPFSRQLQAPSKDTSFLERSSLSAAKRLCVQRHYKRYISVGFSFSFYKSQDEGEV